MAQWQELLKLDSAHQDRVSQIYQEKFPREIRHYLSDWIERQNWDLLAADEIKARDCFGNLLHHLDEQRMRCVQQNNILQAPDFLRMRTYLEHHFNEDPLYLAKIISECLREEREVLGSANETQGDVPNSQAMEKQMELDNKVTELKKQTWMIEQEIKSLEDLYDSFDFITKNWQNQVEQLSGSGQSQALREEEYRKEVNFIIQTKQVVLLQIKKNLTLAEQIVSTLLAVELPEWMHRQQVACIGSPADTSLDQLQMWFTAVGEVLQQMRQQLKKLQAQDLTPAQDPSSCASDLLNLMAHVEELIVCQFRKLLENALVIEKQPCSSCQRPLILKTGVRFSVKTRFLVNLPEFNCVLKVKLEFDKDVAEKEKIKGFRQFAFTTNSSKVLHVETSGGGLMAEFGHLSLKECKAKGKGSNESPLVVTEELHSIKFVTELQWDGLHVDIEASSLPLVVVSGTSQVPSAWASILWCSMLTSESRNLSLFLSPPPVTWEQLSKVLSWQFLFVGERGLNENQLAMLREKLVDNPDGLVSWGKFCKNEGVWFWINGILDLIKKHLLNLWRDGSIMGFVSKQTAHTLLKEKQSGTFLLRFSETTRDGAITFSWVERSNGKSHVHNVEPYTKMELNYPPLTEIIHTYSVKAPGNTHRNPLLYLYPDIPKEHAFRSDSKKLELSTIDPNTGYVVRTVIHVSDDVTPPSSPSSETTLMESETDTAMDWRAS